MNSQTVRGRNSFRDEGIEVNTIQVIEESIKDRDRSYGRGRRSVTGRFSRSRRDRGSRTVNPLIGLKVKRERVISVENQDTLEGSVGKGKGSR